MSRSSRPPWFWQPESVFSVCSVSLCLNPKPHRPASVPPELSELDRSSFTVTKARSHEEKFMLKLPEFFVVFDFFEGFVGFVVKQTSSHRLNPPRAQRDGIHGIILASPEHGMSRSREDTKKTGLAIRSARRRHCMKTSITRPGRDWESMLRSNRARRIWQPEYFPSASLRLCDEKSVADFHCKPKHMRGEPGAHSRKLKLSLRYCLL